MGRRLTRKEIKKRDPITEFLVEIWTWIVSNSRSLWIGAGIVTAAVILYMVGSMWYNRSASTRSVAMQKALEVYDAKVDPSVKEPKEGVYPTTEAKLKAALKSFEEIERSEGSSSDGQLASFYKAACLRELGRLPESAALLAKLQEDVDDARQLQVIQLALAETYRSQGKYDEAIRLLDTLEKAESPAFASEALAYNKALCLEEKGSYKQALELLESTKARLTEKKRTEQFFSPYDNAIDGRIESLRARSSKPAPPAS